MGTGRVRGDVGRQSSRMHVSGSKQMFRVGEWREREETKQLVAGREDSQGGNNCQRGRRMAKSGWPSQGLRAS